MELFNTKQLGWILIGIFVAFLVVHSFMVSEILDLQTILAAGSRRRG